MFFVISIGLLFFIIWLLKWHLSIQYAVSDRNTGREEKAWEDLGLCVLGSQKTDMQSATGRLKPDDQVWSCVWVQAMVEGTWSRSWMKCRSMTRMKTRGRCVIRSQEQWEDDTRFSLHKDVIAYQECTESPTTVLGITEYSREIHAPELWLWNQHH